MYLYFSCIKAGGQYLCEVRFAFKDVYVSEDKTNLYFGNSQVEA